MRFYGGFLTKYLANIALRGAVFIFDELCVYVCFLDEPRFRFNLPSFDKFAILRDHSLTGSKALRIARTMSWFKKLKLFMRILQGRLLLQIGDGTQSSGRNVFAVFKAVFLGHNSFEIEGSGNLIIIGTENIVDFKLVIKGSNNRVNLSCRSLIGSHVRIRGDHNRLCMDDGSRLERAFIAVEKDYNRVFLGQGLFVFKSEIRISGNRSFLSIGPTDQAMEEAKIFVSAGSLFSIGKNSGLGSCDLYFTATQSHLRKHWIKIGDNVVFAHGCVVRNTDGHSILNGWGKVVNEPANIIIEDDVWLMTRCIILKGTRLKRGTAVAANSLVNKSFDEEHILIGGTPARILKRNFFWDRRPYHVMREEQELSASKRS